MDSCGGARYYPVECPSGLLLLWEEKLDIYPKLSSICPKGFRFPRTSGLPELRLATSQAEKPWKAMGRQVLSTEAQGPSAVCVGWGRGSSQTVRGWLPYAPTGPWLPSLYRISTLSVTESGSQVDRENKASHTEKEEKQLFSVTFPFNTILMPCSHIEMFWVEGHHPDPAVDPPHYRDKRMSSMEEVAWPSCGVLKHDTLLPGFQRGSRRFGINRKTEEIQRKE